MLIRHFMDIMRARDGLPDRELDGGALSSLQELEWSGNVRELRNTVERLLILASGDRITADDVDLPGVWGNRSGPALAQTCSLPVPFRNSRNRPSAASLSRN